MYQVREMNTTGTKDPIDKDHIREDQCPPCQEQKRHDKIHDQDIGKFLHGIKLPFSIDLIWRIFPFKDANGIEPELL